MSLSYQLLQPVLDVSQLAGLAGFRIGVADLLQASDELEHMLHADLGAERLQVDDSVLFGLVVAGALSGV